MSNLRMLNLKPQVLPLRFALLISKPKLVQLLLTLHNPLLCKVNRKLTVLNQRLRLLNSRNLLSHGVLYIRFSIQLTQESVQQLDHHY